MDARGKPAQDAFLMHSVDINDNRVDTRASHALPPGIATVPPYWG
jgi:hypothetical protein